MSDKAQNQPANAGQRSRRGVLVAVIGIPVAAALAAVFFYSSDKAPSRDPASTARAADLASEHSPSLGNANAKVHIVEFLDPACGTCALFYPMVKGWMNEVPGEMRLSVRHVAFHTGVEQAVKILEASRQQDRYWQTLEALLSSQQQWVRNHVVQPDKIWGVIADVGLDREQLMADMESVEVLQRIERDKQDAISLKVSATPEYFVNGRPLPSFGRQQLATLIREELEK